MDFVQNHLKVAAKLIPIHEVREVSVYHTPNSDADIFKQNTEKLTASYI